MTREEHSVTRWRFGADRSAERVFMIPVMAILLTAFGVVAGPGPSLFALGTSLSATADATREPARETDDELDFAVFREHIEPIFLDERGGIWGVGGACVTCHTWQTGTPFRLEPLEEGPDGSVFWTEEQSRLNYLAVAQLVTPGFPELSRLLRKPLAAQAGGTEYHNGGTYWESTDDPEWQLLAQWVASATRRPAGAVPPQGGTVDFDFFQSCVQPIFLEPIEGAVPCTSCHGSGVRGFARPIPDGRAFWNEEESRENFRVALQFIEPGNPEGSRLLIHPLHPEAGGSYMHNGGRRWMSRDDPEWRMLEAWVQGDRVGNECY